MDNKTEDEYRSFLRQNPSELAQSRLVKSSMYKILVTNYQSFETETSSCCRTIICGLLPLLQIMKEKYEDGVLLLHQTLKDTLDNRKPTPTPNLGDVNKTTISPEGDISSGINLILAGLKNHDELMIQLLAHLELNDGDHLYHENEEVHHYNTADNNARDTVGSVSEIKDEKYTEDKDNNEDYKDLTDFVKIEADFSEASADIQADFIRNNADDNNTDETTDNFASEIQGKYFDDLLTNQKSISTGNGIKSENEVSYADDITDNNESINEEAFDKIKVESSRQFDSLNKLKYIHTKEKGFSCDVCNERFSSKRKVTNHKVIHFKKDNVGLAQYTCDICQHIFETIVNLHEHTLSTHASDFDSKSNKICSAAIDKSYKCEECGESFVKKFKLTEHIRVHSVKLKEDNKKKEVENQVFHCNLCDKNFQTKYKFAQHERKHSGDRPYSCDMCHKAFKDKQTMTVHMRTHTGEKPYCCDQCGRGFSQKTRLNEHMRTHTGEKPFECDVCNKFLSSKKSLQKHKRIHTGEKPFNCDQCGLAFRGLDNLIQHIQIHNGEKGFKCGDCDKSFYSNFRLNEHKRIHTGEKPFECDVCNKFFSTSRILKRHKIIHTGIKPYQCEQCGKEFAHRFLLAKHTKIHAAKTI